LTLYIRTVLSRSKTRKARERSIIEFATHSNSAYADPSGCFGSEVLTGGEEEGEHWLPAVEDRANLVYRDDDVFSRVSINGSYGIGEARSIYVPVPAISVSDGGAGVTGGAEVHMGLWLPIIEGCDYDSAEIADECKVPILSEIGPYYDDGDVDALTPADRLGRFLIENFVPHGYGVAQISVFGTGESNHCMDLMGYDEQEGIHAAVEYLGQAPFSNGAVGIIGKSYDGSTSLGGGSDGFTISQDHCADVWSNWRP
jgi:Predicted acyl esterases